MLGSSWLDQIRVKFRETPYTRSGIYFEQLRSLTDEQMGLTLEFHLWLQTERFGVETILDPDPFQNNGSEFGLDSESTLLVSNPVPIKETEPPFGIGST